MATLKINGDTSGYVELVSPAVAGSTSIELDKILVSDSSGNVGIGTTSPNTTLDIVSPSNAEAIHIRGRSADDIGQLKFYENDGTTSLARLDSRTTHFEVGSYNELRFSAGGVGNSHVVIDTSGNAGIGTDAPTARLDVRRGDADGKIAEFHQNTGYGIDIGSSQSVAYISSGYNQRLDFKTDPSSGQTERMSILANGNVGIGTTSPAGNLSILSNNPNIRFDDSDTSNNGEITLDNTSLRIESDPDNAVANSTIKFNVDNDTKMIVLSSGNVGIGTTSPGEKLQIEGTNPRIYVNGDSNSYYPSIRVDGVNGGVSLGTYYGGNISGENSLTFLTGSSETDGGSARLQIRGDNDIEIRNLQSAGGGNDTNALYWKIQNSANTGQYARMGGIKAETVSNWGGKLKFYTKPANGTPNDNVTEQMVIDESGRVTTPNQPAFRAGYTSGSNVTNNVNNKHPFTSVAINRGNNYSGTNARFTAPVAGLYRFSACFWVNANNHGDFAPRLNGSSWVPSAPNSDSIIFVQKADSDIQNLSGTFMLELNANDYVELWSRNYTANYYAGHSWWEGHLIG